MASIPVTFKIEAAEAFEPIYMRALFETGYRMAEGGFPWLTTLPMLEELAATPKAPPTAQQDRTQR